jgi:hypothetical protein
VFGRKRQQHQREEEAAREAERRALFEELAKRPDTICPFLGLEDSRSAYRERVSDSHRCYAFGDPAELSAEQQQKVCLQRGYGNCPRYLRGVLVIPTEELEALRRPQPAPPPSAPPPPPAAPEPVAAGGGGGRGPLLTVALLLLLAVGVGSVAFIALNTNGGVGQATPTPTASLEPTPGESLPTTSEVASPGASATAVPSVPATATPVPTPVVLPSVGPSESGLPTPGPNDQPTGFIVVVRRGEYPVVRINEDDEIVGDAVTTFARRSGAPVERIRISNVIYWRTLAGDYFGLAYSRSLSDTFTVYETFETADGEPRFRELDEDEYRP